MKIRHAALALTILLAAASPAAAQLAIEVRAGGAVGNHHPAASGLEVDPGLAVAALAEYTPAPLVSLYAAYTRASFGCEEGFCTGDPVTFTSHGLAAGLTARPISPIWLRAGVIRNGIAAEGASAEAGLGFEIGGGLDIDLHSPVAIRPGVYYRRHGGTTGGIEGNTAVLVFSIGAAYRIGARP